MSEDTRIYDELAKEKKKKLFWMGMSTGMLIVYIIILLTI